jgi:Pyruvate/2-oxoacid:ferredoxin oxidoreductase delta subunit
VLPPPNSAVRRLSNWLQSRAPRTTPQIRNRPTLRKDYRYCVGCGIGDPHAPICGTLAAKLSRANEFY